MNNKQRIAFFNVIGVFLILILGINFLVLSLIIFYATAKMLARNYIYIRMLGDILGIFELTIGLYLIVDRLCFLFNKHPNIFDFVRKMATVLAKLIMKLLFIKP